MPSHPLKPSKQPEEEKFALRKNEILKNSLRVPGGTTGEAPLAPGKGSHEQAVPEGYEGLSVALPAHLPDESGTDRALGMAWSWRNWLKSKILHMEKRNIWSWRKVQDGKLG